MRKNALKRRLLDGDRAINAWCSVPSSFVAEAIAHLGFDSVTVDMQHGAVDYGDVFGMLQAISTTCATPMVRVPWNDPASVMRILDAGALGVICPMINTPEDAAAFVGACRYPPMGFRSYGPNRAQQYLGPDFWKVANEELLALVMIETKQGLENLDEILATEGLDGVYVGPGDLSMAHGEPPSMVPEDRGVCAAIEKIAERTRALGKIAAVHTNGAETAALRFEQGFQLCTLQSDIRFMSNGAAAELADARARLAATA